MKLIALIAVICASMALAACGSSSSGSSGGGSGSSGSSSTTQSDSTSGASTTTSGKSGKAPKSKPSGAKKEGGGSEALPTVTVPSGPPPTHVVVETLKKGTGAELKKGQSFNAIYVAVNYKTKKPFEAHWKKSEPFSTRYGTGEVVKGWEVGLKGMKVGERRKLILPSNWAYETGAIVYVVELVSINPK